MDEFNQKLLRADIAVNLAYSEALFHAGILTRLEAERIRNGLASIEKRIAYDKNYFLEAEIEDVHGFVLTRLEQLTGEAGKKLRIGRVEAEHQITTFRLWLREEINEITGLLTALEKNLLAAGEKQKNAFLSIKGDFRGKQIVLWLHWCLAYFEMFERDKERFEEVWRRVSVSALGAASSFEIDREEIASILNFEGVSANSLDSAFDLDFALEFAAVCSILHAHLSRFAEEIGNYAINDNAVFNFSDENNQQARLALIQVKASRIFSRQAVLFSLQKISASLFTENFHETKETIFDIAGTTKNCLQAANSVVENLSLKEKASSEKAGKESFQLSEIADYLLKKNVSYGAAIETATRVVRHARDANKNPGEMSLEEFQDFSTLFESDVFKILEVENLISSRTQVGGTAPERVFEALDAAKKILDREQI